jgi:hypothetical protein
VGPHANFDAQTRTVQYELREDVKGGVRTERGHTPERCCVLMSGVEPIDSIRRVFTITPP